MMKNSSRIAALAMLAIGLAGAQNAQAADTYFKQTTAAVSLLNGAQTLLLQVTVPAGRWLITSELGAVNFGPGDFVRCALFSGSRVLDGSGTFIGQADGYPPLAMISNQAVAAPTAPTTIRLRCNTDTTASSGAYIDPGANLVVTPITGAIIR